MRRSYLTAAAFAIVSVLSAAPAFAGFGAFAVDDATGKYGLTWGKQTQREADDQAMKDCGGGSCKVVFRTRAGQCTAVAKQEGGNKVGAAWRGGRDAASLAAVENCQKQTKAQCKLVVTQCNQ